MLDCTRTVREGESSGHGVRGLTEKPKAALSCGELAAKPGKDCLGRSADVGGRLGGANRRVTRSVEARDAERQQEPESVAARERERGARSVARGEKSASGLTSRLYELFPSGLAGLHGMGNGRRDRLALT